jgi:type II secretory pathway predicted ATPase ExeA
MSAKEFFGMTFEPFRSDLEVKELLDLPGTKGVTERIEYTLKVGGVCVITGEVGIGKSTSLRAAVAQFHPSQVVVLGLIANSGSISELYSMIARELGLEPKSTRKSMLAHQVRSTLVDLIAQKKQTFLLCVDEAQLLRTDVLMELHTLSQHIYDSKNLLSLVLCGQNNLLDNLHFRTCAPIASRVVALHHFLPLKAASVEEYILHHVRVAKLKHNPFDESAMTAIFQSSGGILRRINNLARGSLVAAARQKNQVINSEHVRIAGSEII